MTASSYLRQHVLENVLQSCLVLIPTLMLVSLRPASFAWAALISVVLQFLAHSDLPLHFGPFSRALVSPGLHRVHHSIDAHHGRSNFASLFPIWDVLFGTYHAPVPVPETGLHSGVTLRGLDLLTAPFTTATSTAPTNKE